jgi:hypothetical protein
LRTDRITRGYAVYQHGHVTLLEADIEHESYTFQVKGSNHEVYEVHYEEGSWICDCPDWRVEDLRILEVLPANILTAAIFSLQN